VKKIAGFFFNDYRQINRYFLQPYNAYKDYSHRQYVRLDFIVNQRRSCQPTKLNKSLLPLSWTR